jgi:hypothetical protein
MFNNPAFQLSLMATTEPYFLCWPTGEKEMLLVSVGTDMSVGVNANLSPEEMHLLYVGVCGDFAGYLRIFQAIRFPLSALRGDSSASVPGRSPAVAKFWP